MISGRLEPRNSIGFVLRKLLSQLSIERDAVGTLISRCIVTQIIRLLRHQLLELFVIECTELRQDEMIPGLRCSRVG